MLGLDWLSYLNFVNDRPSLIPYMYLGYAMITWADVRRSDYSRHDPALPVPATIYPCVHVGSRRHRGGFALLPAVGTYHEYDITPDLLKFKPSGISGPAPGASTGT